MRYAVYMTPPEGAPLTLAAEDWLGRSAFTAEAGTPAAPPAADPAVPARYGFHATMRAPFRLAERVSEADLLAAFRAFSSRVPPLATRLGVARLARFVALLAEDDAPLAAAHEAALHAFEPFRAPLTEDELARRDPDSLDDRGRALLSRWGYPHVLDRFRFHMTLSGPMEEGAVEGVATAARNQFGPLLGEPHTLVFALFREEEAGGPFIVKAIQDHRDPSS